jgi:hypothetical protein
MIFKIFQLLGTPNEQTWPGVEALPDFSTAFPKWPAQVLTKKVQPLEGSPGVDLLKVRVGRLSCGTVVQVMVRCCVQLNSCPTAIAAARKPNDLCFRFTPCIHVLRALLALQLMLTYNPATRISAKVALQHPYFECLKK